MKAVQDAIEALKLPGGQVMTTGLYVSENWETTNNAACGRGTWTATPSSCGSTT